MAQLHELCDLPFEDGGMAGAGKKPLLVAADGPVVRILRVVAAWNLPKDVRGIVGMSGGIAKSLLRTLNSGV